ncbi:MAG: 4-aminobutyrate aminotransferase [Thermosediminibacterales bacterium]|nr:4-aminobutyrate aminotransferase [Thermosediminibacterales bacterium]
MGKYRMPKIVKGPPGPEVKKLIEEVDYSIEVPTLIRDVLKTEAWIPKKSNGVWIEDLDGNVFLDFSSFHSVLNIGRSHPKVVEACKQALNGEMVGFLEGTRKHLKLLKKLVEITPGNFAKQVYLGMSGSDANEIAVRIARCSTGRPYVMSFLGGYHGQTQISMELTAAGPGLIGTGVRKTYPPIPGIIHVPYPYCYRCPFKQNYPECDLQCLKYIEDWIFQCYIPGDLVSAVVIEPIQGDAGNIVPPYGYLSGLKKLCEKYGILLIADEVQTGFGRTGKMFACEHWNIEPDVICLGKAMASGMPMSAVISRYEFPKIGKKLALHHVFTTMANPICCAAALETIKIIQEEHLVENAAKVGEYMIKRLNDMKKHYRIIGDVRGQGLQIGVEIIKDKNTKEIGAEEVKSICKKAYKNGLALIYYGIYGNVLRIHPPLILTKEQADIGLDIIEKAISEVEREE